MHSESVLKKEFVQNSPEARGKRIRYIRENVLNISRTEFCEDSDITTHTIKGWELGFGGGISKKGAERLLERLSALGVTCSKNWLMEGLGFEPIISGNIIQTEDEQDLQIFDELVLFRKQPNAIDTRIADDAMLPFYTLGEYVGGLMTENIPLCIGKPCIMLLASGQKIVRFVEKNPSTGNTYDLVCSNKATTLCQHKIENVLLSVAAPIIFTRKKAPMK